MRVIELKELTVATYYRPLAGLPTNARLVRVPKGTDFDAETMIRQTINYRQTIEDVLAAPVDSRAGIKVVEIRKAMKILDVLESVEDNQPLILEDDQWSYLDSRVENFDWAVASSGIVQFCDDIHHAKAISKERLAEAARKAGDASDEPEPTSIKAKTRNLVDTPAVYDANHATPELAQV